MTQQSIHGHIEQFSTLGDDDIISSRARYDLRMARIRPKIVIDARRRAWNNAALLRTGGGAVERASLENWYTLRGIVGSNPTLSA